MRAIRELSAVSWLVLRSWQRMGPRTRSGRAPEPTRGVSAVLMRLVFAALIYHFGAMPAQRIASRPHPDWSATWALLGIASYCVGIAFASELPNPRAPNSPLRSALLDMLPLSRLAQLGLSFGQSLWALLPFLGFALALRGQVGASGSLLSSLGLALGLFASCTLAGACLGKLLKRRVTPYWASRTGWLVSLFLVAGIGLVQVSVAALRARPPFGVAVGRALLGTDQLGILVPLWLCVALGVTAFFRLESNYELAEPVRPGATESALAQAGGQRALEDLLSRREPGGRAHWFAGLFQLAYVIGMLFFFRQNQLPSRVVLNFVLLITVQMVTTIGGQRAARGAMRDVLARPLLGALPITPRSTLHAKSAALRRTLLWISAPLAALLATPHYLGWPWPFVLWRLAAVFAAVVVYAEAAVYVAFLTVGLGTTRPRAGAFGSLESFLLVVPFAGLTFAAEPWSAALSLLTLCALTFEARRAALHVVDWLDDPEQGHATEVWRALVVFAGFQGAQLLVLQLASLFGQSLSSTLRFVGVYALAAAALWFPTQREQTSPRPEQRLAFAPLGLMVGALSGGCAWLYLRWFQPSPSGLAELTLNGKLDSALLALTVVGLAPLVEERFFRGWLQSELERSLGARRFMAPLLTALAFALAHPVHSFVPVLVFGLLSGLLMFRTRSLAACTVAHAVHNAIALCLTAS